MFLKCGRKILVKNAILNHPNPKDSPQANLNANKISESYDLIITIIKPFNPYEPSTPSSSAP